MEKKNIFQYCNKNRNGLNDAVTSSYKFFIASQRICKNNMFLTNSDYLLIIMKYF